jgi:hypothetical protein
MSFKSELNRTVSLLRTARNAILGRGGEISATAGLKDLPNAIFNIPADASLAFQTDDDIAFRKIVPVGAEEYAQITRIGGMTYKSKNFIRFPYDDGDVTKYGVDWTPNADGSLSANGTQTVNSSYLLTKFDNPILLNGTYTASFGASMPEKCIVYLTFSDGLGNVTIIKSLKSSGTVTISNRYCTSIRFWVEKDVVFNNVTFYPMMNLGSTAEAFEVQYKGLRDTKVLALESEGANLIPRATRNRQTINGITFTVQDDNSILVNGTATATANFEILRGYMGEYFALEKDGTYTLSGCPEGGSSDTYRLIVQDLEFSQNFMDTGSGYTGIAKKDKYYAFIRVSAGYTANNLVFKPMLNRGSTVLPYSPYGTIVDTFPIPEAVQSLDGYGRGVNADYYNYIEWRNGRAYFVQNTYRKVFDGTEHLVCNTVNSGLYRYRTPIEPKPMTGPGSVIVRCNHYRDGSVYDTYDRKYEVLGASDSGVYFTDPTVQTGSIADMQAKLKAWYDEGDPLTVEYILAEPIVTDITDLLRENFLKVQGGGTIKFENEYNYDVPSTINYITKVGG